MNLVTAGQEFDKRRNLECECFGVTMATSRWMMSLLLLVRYCQLWWTEN